MGITSKDYVLRIAKTSIGSSTLRGHPQKTISTVRNFLKDIDLMDFQSSGELDFNKVLDKHTMQLCKLIQELDKKSSYWGSARKALNLFLGDVAYHAILRKDFSFDLVEKYLEVPLDSQVANRLFFVAQERNIKLPRWETIKGLTPENSAKYQSFASLYAKELRCTRIQLDVLLWGND